MTFTPHNVTAMQSGIGILGSGTGNRSTPNATDIPPWPALLESLEFPPYQL